MIDKMLFIMIKINKKVELIRKNIYVRIEYLLRNYVIIVFIIHCVNRTVVDLLSE